MTIKTLHIENFQSHKASTLEFDKGVNVIVGSSDSGKTAIIRAIRWLVTNRPSGDSFISHWAEETAVTLLLESGTSVSKVKGKQNRYELNDIHFTAFGTDVPQEIKEALNFNETNIQQQLDRPFLLDSSPGEVATHFNKIANLEQIDLGIKTVSGVIRKLEQDVGYNKESLTKYQTELKSFKFLVKLEASVEVLEGKQKMINSKRAQVKSLQALILSLETVEEKISPLVTIIEIKPRVVSLLNKQKTLEEEEAKYEILETQIDVLINVNSQIQFKTIVIKAKPSIDLLITKTKKIEELVFKRTDLNNLTVDFSLVSKLLKSKLEKVENMKEEFEELMPDICPLCETKIKK
jgi:DNA repair protein SbcC/Rad50